VNRRNVVARASALCALSLTAACSGGGGGVAAPAPPAPLASATPIATAIATATHTAAPPTATAAATAVATATPVATPVATPSPAPSATALAGLNDRLYLASGFYGNTIATISQPRQLVALPNGDLLVGSKTSQNGSSTVYLVPNADGMQGAGAPVPFATLPDTEAQGVAFSNSAAAIFVATTNGVWKIPYHVGDQSASSAPVEILKVRTGPVAPNSDGDVHTTTSVAVSGAQLFTSVGSSCNRCTETDPTRAVVLRTDLSGNGQYTVATRIRNAIALAVNPASGTLWVGGAGQDCLVPTVLTTCGGQNNAYLTEGHPYEYLDPATLHGSGTVDYGWPDCEEDRHAYTTGADCSATVVPSIESPAYSTIIGATFYPPNEAGAFAFPASYAGGIFMTFHGSWHEASDGIPVSVPNLVYVPMSGDAPATAMNWNSPDLTSQWSAFLSGYQDPQGNRYGQPSGITVGAEGSLFVADDFAGVVYRLRPSSTPASTARSRDRIH
jgi:glucose/arabinose dehydrogenase